MSTTAALPPGTGGCVVSEERDVLTRLLRRLLVLTGLVIGVWLLGALLHGAHASAAPATTDTASATHSRVSDELTRAVTDLPTPVRTSVGATVDTVLGTVKSATASVHTTAVALPNRVIRTVQSVPGSTVATIDHSVRTIVHTTETVGNAITTVSDPLTSTVDRVVLPVSRTAAPAAPIATAAAPVIAPRGGATHLAVHPARTTVRQAAFGTAERSAPMSPVTVVVGQIVYGQPIVALSDVTGSARTAPAPAPAPEPAPSPSGCVGAPDASGSGTQSGGGAATLVTPAAAARIQFVMLPASHEAALVRTAAGRPTVTPD